MPVSSEALVNRLTRRERSERSVESCLGLSFKPSNFEEGMVLCRSYT